MKGFAVQIVLLFLLVSFSTRAQEKYEREYRIDLKEVPKKALDFIQQIPNVQKVKWYYEESQDGETVEAKFKHKGHKVSVEFTDKGEILDVEIKTRLGEFPKQERQLIRKVLESQFVKYRIRKIQKQFSKLSRAQFQKLFSNPAGFGTYNYEIVVKGKKKKQFELFQLQIDQEGAVLSQLKFAPPNSLNLEF
ncbi:MAG: hypothetical protein CMB99_13140 [Flavobacteriaceae bacterium]|nr:hypothetical protein [Flavobacteriaceae bacterium]|tara:strand:- start:3951 stop:4526 length:576 start_codon:yes stop_codon:yes gene_type:complete